MRVLILGGDGYLGWPTALRFSSRGDDVTVVDNFARRTWHLERGSDSLTPILPLQECIRVWQELSGNAIRPLIGDICDGEFIDDVVRESQPDVIIHYGEQPSAPYSMID